MKCVPLPLCSAALHGRYKVGKGRHLFPLSIKGLSPCPGCTEPTLFSETGSRAPAIFTSDLHAGSGGWGSKAETIGGQPPGAHLIPHYLLAERGDPTALSSGWGTAPGTAHVCFVFRGKSSKKPPLIACFCFLPCFIPYNQYLMNFY